MAGLAVDVPFRAHYQWLSSFGITTSVPRTGRVASVQLGEHAGFFVINRRIKVTFEHPFMARRGDEWGFCSADLLQVGDWLIGQNQQEERIETIERIDAPARTVAIHVPGTNTYLAEGVWVHNDVENQASGVANDTVRTYLSGSGSHHSGSGSHVSSSHMSSHASSGKHSGSSFHSSSHHNGSHSSSHHSGSIHTAIG